MMSEAASREARPECAGGGTHDSMSLGDQLRCYGSTLLKSGVWVLLLAANLCAANNLPASYGMRYGTFMTIIF